MTREEAIIHFEEELYKLEHNPRPAFPDSVEVLKMAIAALREQEKLKTPCELCRYNPPSSSDGKPCTMCPATPKEEV